MKLIGENVLRQLLTLLELNFDNKVDKVLGKDLSTNDYTNEEKDKLSHIEENANNYELPVATAQVLGGVKSGTDITIDTTGNVSVNDNSHKHTIANVQGLQDSLDKKAPILCQTSNLADASVTRAKLAQDALYSPIFYPTTTPYAFNADSIGRTFMTGSTLASSATEVVYTINDDFGLNVPNGTEVAIIRRGDIATKIVFEGVQKSAITGELMATNKTYEIPDAYGMVALKKINYGSSTSWWLVTGNVEVVE